MGRPLEIPGGRSKGTPLPDATDNDLEYWAGRIEGDVADGKARFPEDDAALARAMRAELAKRQGGNDNGAAPAKARSAGNGQRRQAPRSAPRNDQAIQKAPPVEVVTGPIRNAARAAELMASAAEQAHLVSPSPACGTIPDGFEITLAAILVDATRETYNVSGKLALDKTALDKIANAAGVSWDPRMSGRLDDGSNPHYCHYRAVGTVPQFDGTRRTISGEVEIDVRDGSQDERTMEPKQLAGVRKFILRHAESKAKNRAIRSLGVRTGYERAELAKPFVVAKLQFTGHSEDPELRRLFASKLADAALGAAAQLYPSAAPAPALEGHAPPPIDTDGGSAPEHDADGVYPDDPPDYDPEAGTDDYDRGDNPDDY